MENPVAVVTGHHASHRLYKSLLMLLACLLYLPAPNLLTHTGYRHTLIWKWESKGAVIIKLPGISRIGYFSSPY